MQIDELMKGGVPVKLLAVGFPGTGKTGSLAALANAGYNLRILLYDNIGNILPLYNFTKPEFHKNIDVAVMHNRKTTKEVLNQRLKKKVRIVHPVGVPDAVIRGMDMLDRWKYTKDDGTEVDLGPTSEWDPDKDVLVVDSSTALGKAWKLYQMSLNNRLVLGARRSDWGDAQQGFMNFVEMINSPALPCNLVMLAHLKLIGPEEKEFDEEDEAGKIIAAKAAKVIDFKLFPTAIGKAICSEIAGEFGCVVRMEVDRSGKRIISTKPSQEIDIKMPTNLGLPQTLPIETGMLDVFNILKGKKS